jgi:hypothetical protein
LRAQRLLGAEETAVSKENKVPALGEEGDTENKYIN